ncbi:MAG: 3-isopropylmalate dehydrogenase [Acidaminococcaceae bacterium]
MRITLLPGDGIGPEIVDAAVEVLNAAAKKYNMNLEYDHQLIGGVAIEATGHPLPEATVKSAQTADAVLLGAVGGPKWDNVEPALRPEKALLGIRKALGLYCNLRPMKVSRFVSHLSPLKDERVANADLLIVRELTGGIYFGTHNEAALDENGVETASDIEIYSRPEVERIAKFAFEAAKKRKGKVTSVDKANVLASSRMWRRITAEMHDKDYTEVELNNLYVDNCAMQLVLNPGQFDVILTNNIFGDILSDEASVIAGSIGLLPSASLGDGTGMYEPIHGSAPDIAGMGIANPLGTILSAAMMLRYSLNADAAAAAIEEAVDRVLAKGYRTPDLAGPGLTKVSTSEMGHLVAEELLA